MPFLFFCFVPLCTIYLSGTMSESYTSRAGRRHGDISARSMDFEHCRPLCSRRLLALERCDAVQPSDSHQIN
jgi:hypothetical protein